MANMSDLVPADRAFDAVANRYDRDFGENPVGALLRQEIHRCMERFFLPKGLLWDAGCGTGIDAVHFSRKGFKVIATDVSQTMLDVTETKARDVGYADRIQTIHLAADSPDIPNVLARSGEICGIYSNFGALNCLSITNFANNCKILLKPGSCCICVIMGRFSPVESLYFLTKGKLREASRRWSKKDVAASVGENKIMIRYYSPRQFLQFFANGFACELIRPLGLLLPPPFVVPGDHGRKHLYETLARYERVLHAIPFIRGWGDHTLYILRRTEEEPA